MSHLLNGVREVRKNASLKKIAEAATWDAQRAHYRLVEGLRSEDKAEGINARMEAKAWSVERSGEFRMLKDLASHLRRVAKLPPWDYQAEGVEKSEGSE